MPKILITGNGFDLDLNLPTKYSDIITILKGINSNLLKDTAIPNKKILNLYSLLNNSEKFFTCFDISKIKENDTLLNRLYNLKENNTWISFFIDEYQIETWIDFENRIGYAIKNILKTITTIRKS